MRALAITLLSAALVLSPPVAVAGSDSPTPYTVTAEGITLPEGVTFPAHGHVNWTTSWARHGVHFDPNNGAHGGKYIGQSFLPFNLEPGECVTWAQVSMYDPHFGEGGQEPVCRDAEQTPTPEPSEPQEPAVPTDEQPTPEPTPDPTEETPWTPEPQPTTEPTQPAVEPSTPPSPAPSAPTTEAPSGEPSTRPTNVPSEPVSSGTTPSAPKPAPSTPDEQLATPGSPPTSSVPAPAERWARSSDSAEDVVRPVELATTGPGTGAAVLSSLLLVAGIGLTVAALHRRAKR